MKIHFSLLSILISILIIEGRSQILIINCGDAGEGKS
jgi:hypothetical protein